MPGGRCGGRGALGVTELGSRSIFKGSCCAPSLRRGVRRGLQKPAEEGLLSGGHGIRGSRRGGGGDWWCALGVGGVLHGARGGRRGDCDSVRCGGRRGLAACFLKKGLLTIHVVGGVGCRSGGVCGEIGGVGGRVRLRGGVGKCGSSPGSIVVTWCTL